MDTSMIRTTIDSSCSVIHTESCSNYHGHYSYCSVVNQVLGILRREKKKKEEGEHESQGRMTEANTVVIFSVTGTITWMDSSSDTTGRTM